MRKINVSIVLIRSHMSSRSLCQSLGRKGDWGQATPPPRFLFVQTGGEETPGFVMEPRLVALPRIDRFLSLYGRKARNGLG